MKVVGIILLFLLILPSSLLADVDGEIGHLLEFVRTSDVVFIRNGQEYKSAEAVDHFRKKREHFVKEIKSAEDFIAVAATKSLVSGQAYQVKTRDGQVQDCSKWLTEELKRFRNEKKSVTNNVSDATGTTVTGR